jgi:type IV secretory pathway VirB4 component
MVLALRQVNQNEDAAILSLVAYAAALRRALEFPLSVFFIDETPIVFKFPSIRGLVEQIISNGAKSGMRVIISAQSPDKIYTAKEGQQIFSNINTTITGKIVKKAIANTEEILQYPHEVVVRCAKFMRNRYQLYTQWLVDDDGVLSFCRFYVPFVVLALVANNSDEQKVRDQVASLTEDKFEAISLFADILVGSIRASKNLEDYLPEYLSNKKIIAT